MKLEKEQMARMVYEWRPDTRYPVAAQIAAERLAKIKKTTGSITPRNVVDDAADARSPLHKCFEWDDEKAADGYRLEQARHLVRNIVVAQVDNAPVKRETRAYVNVTTPEGRSYENIEVAMADRDMRQQVLSRAKSEISAWRRRYAAYEEFGNLHLTIDEVLAA